MNETLRVLMLLNACQASVTVWETIKSEGAVDAFESSGEPCWKRWGLKSAACTKLEKLLKSGNWPENELERVDKFGGRFIAIDDVEYPQRLKDLASPPLGIYVKGELNSVKPCVAIVGTRHCSSYGRAVAEKLGQACALAGAQVVSGGAAGIDSAGHNGCLAANGTTVAVMGTGIDCVYPAENRELFHHIAERGALVSEYVMKTGGEAWHFPARNRIIVGLASYVVVVESPEDGGSMITARLGLDAGRDIWCVPGRITDDTSRGTNALLRDGANPLVDIDDFVGRISGRYGQLFLEFPETPPSPELSADERTVLELLQKNDNVTLDEIIAKSGLGFVETQICLASLTAAGLVEPSGPGRYSASV